MVSRATRIIIALGFVALAAMFLIGLTDLPDAAGRVPRVIAVPMLAMAVLNVFREWRVSPDAFDARPPRQTTDGGLASSTERDEAGQPFDVDAEVEKHEAAPSTGIEPSGSLRTELKPWLWLGGVIASVLLLGTALGGMFFISLYLRFEGRVNWRLIAVVAAGYLVFIYGLVERLLNVRVFEGLLLTLA